MSDAVTVTEVTPASHSPMNQRICDILFGSLAILFINKVICFKY